MIGRAIQQASDQRRSPLLRRGLLAESPHGELGREGRQPCFDPFFTTKEVGRGTGQGLASARTLIREKHAGDLTFETRVGQGTTFWVRLPIAGKPA